MLQCQFAGHMLYLEEHRDVGDSSERADQLISAHKLYMENAQEEMEAAMALEERGMALVARGETELAGSLGPKCQELRRMADALSASLQRRLHTLNLSKKMHQQITEANRWCREGVDLLSGLGWEVGSREEAEASVDSLSAFLATTPLIQQLPTSAADINSEQTGKRDSEAAAQSTTGEEYDSSASSTNSDHDKQGLMLISTTETSTLLQQVSARIDDVRSMCESRRNNLQRSVDKEKLKPIQVVSPEKVSNSKKKSRNSPKKEIEVLHEHQQKVVETKVSVGSSPISAGCFDTPSTSKSNFVIQELLETEEIYVEELGSVVKYYINEFTSPIVQASNNIPTALRGKDKELFSNLESIWDFHAHSFLPALKTAASQDCQKRAGHRLPLGAYLLKPVQRITKYQLLLRELSKTLSDDHSHQQMMSTNIVMMNNPQQQQQQQQQQEKSEVEAALLDVLSLLQQLNASLQEFNIASYPGDLSNAGQLLLQSRFSVWVSRRGDRSSSLKLRKASKTQQRHLFLYGRSLVFCKRRVQPSPLIKEYFEFKMEIPMSELCMSETVKGHGNRFEVWRETGQESYTLQPEHSTTKADWIRRLKQLENGPATIRLDRPHSWGSSSPSTVSSAEESNRSSRDMTHELEQMEGDTNNNPSTPQSLPEETTTIISDYSTTADISDHLNNPLTPKLRRVSSGYGGDQTTGMVGSGANVVGTTDNATTTTTRNSPTLINNGPTSFQ